MHDESDINLMKRMHARNEALEEALWNCRFALVQTVHAMSAVAEQQDEHTARHQRRVAELAVALGRHMQLDSERLEGLYLGALVHDIGKTGIPKEILTKPGPLTREERAVVQTHARIGSDILAPVILPWPVHVIVAQHHERLDGSGYPDGLLGEQMLLESRIVAVADVFQSMCDDRPYREALSVQTALAELERGEGVIYDADAVCALRAVIVHPKRSVEALWNRFAGDTHSVIGRVRRTA